MMGNTNHSDAEAAKLEQEVWEMLYGPDSNPAITEAVLNAMRSKDAPRVPWPPETGKVCTHPGWQEARKKLLKAGFHDRKQAPQE